LQVNGPVNETAIFYAEVMITPASNGHVSYTYGSSSGTAAGGSTTTLYIPPGSNVSLSASSDSLLYSPGSWSVGNGSSSGNQVNLSVNGPTTVGISFGLDTTIIALIAAVVIGVGLAAVFLSLRKRGGGDFGPGTSHTWKW